MPIRGCTDITHHNDFGFFFLWKITDAIWYVETKLETGIIHDYFETGILHDYLIAASMHD